MWINKKLFFDTHDARVRAEAIRDQLAQHNKALEVTLDWMRVRLTQLEHERAILINNYMGISVPVPSVVRERPTADADPYHTTQTFHDMGDKEAERQGIGWAPDGTLLYGVPKSE